MGTFDVQSLVIYEDSEVIGVKGFHVEKALLEGQQEGLSALVPSQWGSVHLFDLCIRFGHMDTALALARHGVTGCKLEEHHLGPLPDASGAVLRGRCGCEGWMTCRRCCWGFPVDNGVWMTDWKAPLVDAKAAARKAAKTPLVKAILEISSTEVLPLAMSDAVAARLLHIAILCSNSEAVANLAKNCPVRPLRRWRGEELWQPDDLPVLSAALLAGADFHDLHVCLDDGVEFPLLLRVALDFDSQDWQQLGHCFSSTPRWPSRDLQLGTWFVDDTDYMDHISISMQKVQNGLRSGWNLKHVWIRLEEQDLGLEDHNPVSVDAGLLDLAILCGKPDCADALATAGVELREDCLDWLKGACRGESLASICAIDLFSYCIALGSASECMSAAAAAARASLRRSFKSEGVEKGVAVYQTLAEKFHPRGVDQALVHHILGFAMEAPKILDQLELWDEVRDWLPPYEVKAQVTKP